MNSGLAQSLSSIGLAAVTSGAILVLGRLAFNRSQYFGGYISIWALSVGYFVGCWVLFGIPTFPPGEGSYWLVWFLLAISLFGRMGQMRQVSWFHWILRGGTLSISIVLQFLQMPAHEWILCQGVYCIVGLVASCLFFWWAIEKLIERTTSIESVMVWLLYSIMIGLLVVFLGELRLGQGLAILASCLVILWIGTILGLRSINLKLLMPVVVIALSFPVQHMILNNEMTLVSAACLLVAPCASWAAVRWLDVRKAWLRILVLATVVTLVCGIAVAWSISHLSEGSY